MVVLPGIGGGEDGERKRWCVRRTHADLDRTEGLSHGPFDAHSATKRPWRELGDELALMSYPSVRPEGLRTGPRYSGADGPHVSVSTCRVVLP